VVLPPRALSFNYHNEYFHQYYDEWESSDCIALDYETKGNDPTHPDFEAVGLGIGWDTGHCYYDLSQMHEDDILVLHQTLAELAETIPTIAHNVYFDGAVWYRVTGKHLNWTACTYGLYKQLTSEGVPGQRYGLKSIQEQILGWTETNEAELDTWLIDNGYHKNISKEYKNGYYWYDNAGKDEAGRWKSPDKAEMWRAPADVLGKYCQLDCEATYLLYTQVLHPQYTTFPDLEEYHTELFLTLVEVHIDQRFIGINIDKSQLEHQLLELTQIMEKESSAFRTHPEIIDFIEEYERGLLDELASREPTKYRKAKPAPKEPKKFKKDGNISKSWHNWEDKMNKREWAKTPISKNWLNWEAKYYKAKAGELYDYTFKIGSPAQLTNVIYSHYAKGYWKVIKSHRPDPRGGSKPATRGLIRLETPDGRTVELDMTDGGSFPTGKIALKQLGDVGEILLRYNAAKKEAEYIQSYLNLIRYSEDTELWTLHPAFNIPGTLTGRLGGKDPNIQQIPKSVGTCSGFIPRPGYVWVDNDHSALEQVVLAELSRDSTLLKLYGPEAKANDVYLYVGSFLPGGIGDRIRASGYDPDNPTKEGIAAAKKECKRERSISKVVVLASSYGAGAGKIFKTLYLSGIDITEAQVKAILETYWDLFAGVKDWESDLVSEYKARGGWFVGGLGRPICLWEGMLKDIVNRMCQATGHDVHMLYVKIIRDLLDSEGIEWYPIIIDWHDQSIVECKPEDAERVAYLIGHRAYEVLNEELGGLIPMKGDPQVIDNLAYAKCEKDEIEDYIHELLEA
jgi:DNA polymerase I-like protein with 3'-5' exonuclease and polymerase domains